MIPEIGHFAMLLALCVTIAQTVIPLIGAYTANTAWCQFGITAARVQAALLTLSYACLTYSFIISDFTVMYVAKTSNTALPMIYKISGVWGGHEGSLMLWALLLSLWGLAITFFSYQVPRIMLARVMGVMGFITTGFLLFIALTSNPFERLLPAPLEGRSLNPLLQDFGLAIHPPMLYMGYVGFSVAFAFAIAALLSGRLDAAWARWMRPWTNIAWLFLTLGIALGSWWAYYELGWGGWWFWDPVENASFMPWLVGTALIHSLAATEKRSTFKAWTVLLAVFAFSLSLLGTFLVRSGVLTSVHAFATDPERGVFILAFLSVVIGGSLMLYAWRAPNIRSTGGFSLISREAGLLVNNIFLVTICGTVLLGTLYPLILDALGAGKISVGPPYFNSLFVPLSTALALIVGVGALLRWKQDDLHAVLKRTRWAMIISLVAAAVLPSLLMGSSSWQASLGIALGVWVSFTAYQAIADRLANKKDKLQALLNIPAAFWGMIFGHIGIAVFAVGVSLTSIYSVEKDLRMAPGEQYKIQDYTFTFNGVETTQGPNYKAMQGQVSVSRDGDIEAVLRPQKRFYVSGGNAMTEAAIDPGFTRDLYVALGEQLEAGAWSVRLYHKPYIRWIWLGSILMSIGALLGALDPRYRRRKAAKPQQQAAPILEAKS